MEGEIRVLDVSVMYQYSKVNLDHHREKVELYVSRNQPEGSRGLNAAPTLTFTKASVPSEGLEGQVGSVNVDLQSVERGD